MNKSYMRLSAVYSLSSSDGRPVSRSFGSGGGYAEASAQACVWRLLSLLSKYALQSIRTGAVYSMVVSFIFAYFVRFKLVPIIQFYFPLCPKYEQIFRSHKSQYCQVELLRFLSVFLQVPQYFELDN